MKNKSGILLLIISIFQIIFSLFFPAYASKFIHNEYLIIFFSFFLIPIIFLILFLTRLRPKKFEVLSTVSLMLVLLPLFAFSILSVVIRDDEEVISSLKAYSWKIKDYAVSFQYPDDWIVENNKNIVIRIHPKDDEKNNIRIDTSTNQCDYSKPKSYSRCINVGGHIVILDYESSERIFLRKLNQILSSIKFSITSQDSYKASCDKKQDKQTCLKEYEEVYQCDLMPGTIDSWGSLEVWKKNECYKKVAATYKDFYICDEKLGRGPDCYNDVAIATGEVDNCSLVPLDGGYRNSCYIELAKNKKDLSICENIVNTIGNVQGEAWQTQGSNGEEVNYWEDEQCYEAVAIAKKDASICELITNTPENYMNCLSKTKDALDFEKISLNTNDWLTYRNEQYGFEFKYPKEILISDKIKGNNLFLIKSADLDFSVFTDKKNNLSFNEIPGGGGLYYFDQEKNLWMNTPPGGQEEAVPCSDKGYQNFIPIGEDNIPVIRLGTGDAGFAFDDYFIITNKDFGIVISSGMNSETTRKETDIQDKMLNSFRLINDTKAIESNNCKKL